MRWNRLFLQVGFLALTVVAVFIVRDNAEAWCPFGGVEGLYLYVAEGNLPCSLGVSNFYILIGVLAMTLLARRAFCSHACPIGTISEWVGRGARRLGLRSRTLPPQVDRGLSLLKYPVLAVILYATYRTGELLFRGYDPCYALISRHGEDIAIWAYVVAAGILVGSLLVKLPFCRWLCPLAAVLQPFSRVGLTRVQRDRSTCVDCGRCAQQCPMEIPVDRVSEVAAGHCTSCLECIRACPVADRGALGWGPVAFTRRGRWPQWAAALIVILCVTASATAVQLRPLPSFTYQRAGPTYAEAATVDFKVEGLTCRGRATLLVFFLDRDDEYAIPGSVHLEAWPAPTLGRVRITYDPRQVEAAELRAAITEPYYNPAEDLWRTSPFVLAGYDPVGDLGAPEDPASEDR